MNDDTPMSQAPKPISNVVVIVCGIVAIIAVAGVVALAVLRPNDDIFPIVTAILAVVGAFVAAFLGVTNKQDIQIIHKAVNSQYAKWVKESNEAATVAATLAAERVATAERQHIAEIVKEETARLAQAVKADTLAAVETARAAPATVKAE